VISYVAGVVGMAIFKLRHERVEGIKKIEIGAGV
jgi:hypothetical protein